jgi:hypothetical protein
VRKLYRNGNSYTLFHHSYQVAIVLLYFSSRAAGFRNQ